MKQILIIGASKGIGLELATLLSKEHQVWGLSRGPSPLSAPNFHALSGDILSEDLPVDQLPEQLDGLAYLPGTINLKPFRGLKPEDFLRDFEVNCLGAVKAIQQVLKPLKKSPAASVVLFSTVAVQQGMGFHSSIAAAKGAVEGLTRSLAAEFAPRIRVNCVAPSLTDTPLAEGLLSSEKKKESAMQRHPLKQYGDAGDVARAAEFLLTDASKWVSGQVLGIDGGLSTLRV